MKGIIALVTEGSPGARGELKTMASLIESKRAADEISFYHHLYGRVRLAEGKIEEGLDDLQTAVDLSSREWRGYFTKELVKGYIEAGSIDDSIREGLALLERTPNDAELFCLLGSAYERRGDRAQMGEYLGRALEIWREADRDFLPLRKARDMM
jgi:tetratricopeptide (TPR) repeat protein